MSGEGALSGLRVIDLSTIAAAPSCSQTLADHGADVIKVEPATGDDVRRLGAVIDGQTTQYRGMNRGKRGISLDLAKPEAQEVLLRLLADADILLENFKTGTLEKWGLGYDAVLRPRFPRLIHCRVTGFGATGPYGGFPGYDGIAQALGGMIAMNGAADGPPIRNCAPMADLCTGMHALAGILMAVLERDRSGVGQSVEVALLDTAASLLYPFAHNHFAGADPATFTRMGCAHPALAPYNRFAAADGYVMLAVLNDAQFAACCAVLGAPELAARPDFATNADRLANRAALESALADLFAGRARMDVARELAAVGVPAAPVLSVPEIFDYPGLADTGTVIESPGGVRSVAAPARLSRTPPRFWRDSPAYAEHLGEVLTEAGYGAADIDGLIAREVVFPEQRAAPPEAGPKLDDAARAARIPADAPPSPAASEDGALAGLKVVDLTHHVAGPWCTQILGDHGADIVKVEPPKGDPTRHFGPRDPAGGTAAFLGVNRNKRSRVLDLGTEAGRAALLELLADADLLVENFAPGTMETWGLGYAEVLAERFPRLIYCRISAFAADGPLGALPGADATAQAMAGVMSVNGAPEDPPTRSGSFAASVCAGLTAVGGILTALIERSRSGKGQAVEVSMFHALLSILYPTVPDWLMAEKAPVRRGNTHANLAPHDVYRTKDGYVFTSLVNPRQFSQFCREIGAPEIAEDKRFATNEARLANVEALREVIEAALADKGSEKVAEELLAKTVPVGAVLSVEEVLNHPQVRHREMVLETGAYRGLGFPIKMSRTPARLRRLPPALGADGAAP